MVKNKICAILSPSTKFVPDMIHYNGKLGIAMVLLTFFKANIESVVKAH